MDSEGPVVHVQAGKGHSARARKSDGLERGQQTMTQLEFVSSGQRKLEDDIEDDDDDLDYKGPYLESPARAPQASHQTDTAFLA